MGLKDILVCLDPTRAGEGRLRLAAAIAREHHAHLSAAYVAPAASPDLPILSGFGFAAPVGATSGGEADFTSGLALATPTEAPRGTELGDILEQRFYEAVQGHAIASDWHVFADDESAELIALLRTVDLAIVGQISPDHRAPNGFRPADIVVACGRPLLVVPYTGDFDTVGRRVMIAWDGTREASRGLHDALPLIAKAETVIVTTVRADEASFERDVPSLDRVVRHLQRHGIQARPEETLQGDIPIADVLLSRAADLDIDLIVAGAYHHSELREALIGGVSRELLDHMTVPVLMSH